MDEDSSKITITYNANGKIDVFLTEYWSGSAWGVGEKSTYTYDANNRIIIRNSESWNGAIWYSDYTEEFTYDANGNAITTKESYLDDGVWEYYIEESTFDTTKLIADFIHPFKDKTGIEELLYGTLIVNKILTRTTENTKITYYYGEATAKANDFNFLKLDVYPNPTNNLITIGNSNFNIKKVELFNVLGKKIISTTKNQLKLENLVNGIYLFKVQDDNGSVVVKRIIKN